MAYLEELTIDNDQLAIKKYTGGTGIEITPEGVINATGGQGGQQTSWNDITGKPDFKPVATSGSYNDLTDKPAIPSPYDDSALSGRVSTLESGKQDKLTAGDNISITGNTISAADTKYAAGTGISISTANQISAERHAGNTYTKEEVNNLNVSTFNNDANYQTHTQVTNLIQGELANFERWDYKIVTALPATGESGVRYLIKNSNNTYEEWIYVDGQYYDIGSTGTTGPVVIPVNPSPEPTAQGAIWITT